MIITVNDGKSSFFAAPTLGDFSPYYKCCQGVRISQSGGDKTAASGVFDVAKRKKFLPFHCDASRIARQAGNHPEKDASAYR